MLEFCFCPTSSTLRRSSQHSTPAAFIKVSSLPVSSYSNSWRLQLLSDGAKIRSLKSQLCVFLWSQHLDFSYCSTPHLNFFMSAFRVFSFFYIHLHLILLEIACLPLSWDVREGCVCSWEGSSSSEHNSSYWGNSCWLENFRWYHHKCFKLNLRAGTSDSQQHYKNVLKHTRITKILRSFPVPIPISFHRKAWKRARVSNFTSYITSHITNHTRLNKQHYSGTGCHTEPPTPEMSRLISSRGTNTNP